MDWYQITALIGLTLFVAGVFFADPDWGPADLWGGAIVLFLVSGIGWLAT